MAKSREDRFMSAGLPSAKVIKHSKIYNEELITIEIELHRFILPEFNTHRSLSRNFQSSRAVPTRKILDQVRLNPAMPVYWGKNQRGMCAKEELEGDVLNKMKTCWTDGAMVAVALAEEMLDNGLHKQIANRLLEPFMWTKGVVTGTKVAWDAFLALRDHPAAQPEIRALAIEIRDAINSSEAIERVVGDWHLPYVNDDLTLADAIMVSISCCAQVSYRSLDDSLEKARKIYEMLNFPTKGVYPENPCHFSPAEHVAQITDISPYDQTPSEIGGNFQSLRFYQYRKLLEQGLETYYVAL
jgi:thymidylate synthase ThyX